MPTPILSLEDGNTTAQPATVPRPRRSRRRQSGAPHVCSHCARTFKRTEHLDRHVRTHTKEKPFICQCGVAFTRRDLLTRHHRLTSHDGGVTGVFAGSARGQVPFPNGSSLPPGGPQHQHQHQPEHPDAAVGIQMAPPTTGMLPFHEPMMQAPSAFEDSFSMNGMEQFREFADFLEGVGLPAEWSPFFNNLDRDPEPVDHAVRSPEPPILHPSSRPGSHPCTRPGTPFSSWLPSAPPGSRISSSGINIEKGDGHQQELQSSSLPKVTEAQRAGLAQSMESLQTILDPDFQLPSRHALTRYATSYITGFHSHMVFMHVPTWSVLDSPVELLLSVAAIGAQYCFEHRVSERLFYASKAVLMERLASEADRFGPKTKRILNMHGYKPAREPRREPAENRVNGDDDNRWKSWGHWEPIDTVRALINTMGYATWEMKTCLVQEAIVLQDLLVQVLRDLGLEDPGGADLVSDSTTSLQASWHSWIHKESVRRAKLIAFSFIHTHSVAYNVYPALRSNEIRLRLPCCTEEWTATTAPAWQAIRQTVRKQQLYFQEALSLLLDDTVDAALDPIPSPIGNYILLHGLIQRIHIVRDLSLPIMDQSASLPADEVDKLNMVSGMNILVNSPPRSRALRSWTTSWQQAPESSLDPNNENGPIPFTSSSLLGLAYTRVYLNLGPCRQLDTRDAGQIARALKKCPSIDRGDGVISALLYAIHALSVPVRLGIDRVARSQAFFWSVRHALSGLECAILLSQWLACLHDTVQTMPLTGSEDRILQWVRQVVEEAFAVVDFEEGSDTDPRRDFKGLSLDVLKIWAHFFERNAQWRFINLIGTSLRQYRHILIADMDGEG